MCLQQRYLDPLPREQEGEHRAGRTTSYNAAGGLLYPLRLIIQPCGSAHGHLLSEWAANETAKKAEPTNPLRAAAWPSPSRSLQPDGDQLLRVGVALRFPLGFGEVTAGEEEDHQRRDEHRRRCLQRQVLPQLAGLDAGGEVAGEEFRAFPDQPLPRRPHLGVDLGGCERHDDDLLVPPQRREPTRCHGAQHLGDWFTRCILQEWTQLSPEGPPSLQPVCQDSGEQARLGREVVEDEALSDPYLASDLPRRGGVEALRRKQLKRRPEDLLPPSRRLQLSRGGPPAGRCIASSHPRALLPHLFVEHSLVEYLLIIPCWRGSVNERGLTLLL